jgi:hypothetical protein
MGGGGKKARRDAGRRPGFEGPINYPKLKY